jgi:hypothetical protein
VAEVKSTKVEIVLKSGAAEKAKEKKKDPWPWQPMGGDADLPRKLELEIHDATTIWNGSDADFKTLDQFAPTTAVFDQTYNPAVNPTIVKLVQSKQAVPTVEEYAQLYASVDESNCEPLKRMQEADYHVNGDVWPIGVKKPNFTISLINSGGDVIDTVDYNTDLDTTSKGRIGPQERLTYEWLLPEIVRGDLKVEDLMGCAKLISAHALCPSGSNYAAKYGIEDTFNSIFYHKFDTSKRDQIKITTVPTYDCEPDQVVDEPLLNIPSVIRGKLFLFRRQWHAIVTFLSEDQITETSYGLFFLPPREFMMPKSRKTIRWEMFNNSIQESWEYACTDPWDEQQLHKIYNLIGDRRETNSFYLLHAKGGKTGGYSSFYRFQTVGCGPGGNWAQKKWYSWEKVGNSIIPWQRDMKTARDGIDQISLCSAIGLLLHNWTPWEICSDVIGSAPDGKSLTMLQKDKVTIPIEYSVFSWPARGLFGFNAGERVKGSDGTYFEAIVSHVCSYTDLGTNVPPDPNFGEFEPGGGWLCDLPPGQIPGTVGTHWTQYWKIVEGPFSVDRENVYYHDKTLYDSNETAKITALKKFILSNEMLQSNRGKTPKSISISACSALAKELVGIYQAMGSTFYIWRKTDERATPVLTPIESGVYSTLRYSAYGKPGENLQTTSWIGGPLIGPEFDYLDIFPVKIDPRPGGVVFPYDGTKGAKYRGIDPGEPVSITPCSLCADAIWREIAYEFTRDGRICFDEVPVDNPAKRRVTAVSPRRYMKWGKWFDLINPIDPAEFMAGWPQSYAVYSGGIWDGFSVVWKGDCCEERYYLPYWAALNGPHQIIDLKRECFMMLHWGKMINDA